MELLPRDGRPCISKLAHLWENNELDDLSYIPESGGDVIDV
jgi:hypothetical protein